VKWQDIAAALIILAIFVAIVVALLSAGVCLPEACNH